MKQLFEHWQFSHKNLGAKYFNDFLSKTISFNSKRINFFWVRNVGGGEGVTECLTVRYLGGEGGSKTMKNCLQV